jgi:hypothetical protein
VHVLERDGTGLTSDVIAGLEWVLENRAAYRIPVLNLSLAHPMLEPDLIAPGNRIVSLRAAGRFSRKATGTRR